ncbi:helix-turn-helix transcriptional regulator [Planosporangium flavigriseum]|nr:helix-turn-helix transcriptional regulator [Planosporangium flavigriseum]
MDGPIAAHIGTRIRYWRRRRGGMTQAALAGLAGVSQSYISQVESGLKGVERRSTLVAVAAALQVSVADLLGQPGDPADPLKAGADAAVPAIRVTLVEIDEGERRTPARGPEEMAAAVEHITGLRARSEYAPMAGLLPSLLLDAAAYGGAALAEVGHAASECLSSLGYRDMAMFAARVAMNAAQQAENAAWIGSTQFVYTLSLPIEAAHTTSRVANKALSALQDKASDTDVRQMLGQLHLSASLVCAVDQRPADAAAHLVEARREAATLGDPRDGVGFNVLAFGPTNLGLWRMAVETELGEYGRVVELAGTIEPRRLKVANRHQSYWLHLGRALAHSGKTDREALIAFMNAERAAPIPFSLNAMARDAVVVMVHRARRRSVSDDLRMLARRMGVEVAA